MIQQGTDGLSRGDYTAGVMAGQNMLQHVPLHLSAIERSPTLLSWLQTWCLNPTLQPLSPADWYEKGHGICGGVYNGEYMWEPALHSDTLFLWAPPPAAAGAALDELLLSRHKRTHLTHIFVCPRLFTSLWRRRLHKVADIVLELPAGCQSCWPGHMHEPLILGLTLRFISSFPWELKHDSRLLDLGREVSRVWRLPNGNAGHLLCQLLQLPDALDPL
jgi:hypothetical protein